MKIPVLNTLILSAATALTTANTHATNFQWDGPTTGTSGFNFPANWTPAGGPPDDASDTATFNRAGNYTARFASSVTNNNINVDVGVVTLDLFHEDTGMFDDDEPYEYTLDTTSGLSADITSGPGSLFAVKLIVQGDSDPAGGLDPGAEVHTNNSLFIANGPDTNGTLELDNADWISTDDIIVGVTGAGSLNLYNDGDLTNTNGTLGLFSGSQGFASVTDSPTRWRNNGTLTVGGSGAGNLTIEHGGSVTTTGDSFIASAPGSAGTVNMDGGQWLIDSSLYVGGTSTTTGGNATLNLQDTVPNFQTTEVQIDNNMTIRQNATVNLIDQSTLTIDNHLAIDLGGNLTINGEFATVNTNTFTGAPNTLTFTQGTLNILNDDFTADANSPTGSTFFLSNASTLNVAQTLRIGPTAGALMFIINSSHTNADNLEIGNTPIATTNIPLAVDGTGSILNVTNNITMGANSPTNSAQLVITDGGLVNNTNTFASPLPGQNSEILTNTLVAGDPQWNNTGSVYLGGTDTTPGGTASLTILAGTVNIDTMLRVWDNATLDIDAGTLNTPHLHHAGTFNATTPLDFSGPGPIATLNLDGGTINAPEINLGAIDHTAHGQLNGDVTAHGTITANGTLTIGDPASFTALNLTGPLNVGPHTVNLHKAGFYNFGSLTAIAGGTLNVPNGVAIPVGNSVSAHGAITGRFVQQSGSSVIANGGDLTLGDPTSLAGFFSDGELLADNGDTITLHDANQAVLGSLTTLGTTTTKGNLTAPNALILEFGKNIQGFGTVDTPNDPAKPFINNGHIQGHAPDRKLTLKGYIKGVGSFQDVFIDGTLAPGFSPGINHANDIAFGPASTYEAELLSATSPDPGVHHDQLIVTGNVTLNGTLAITPLPIPDALTSIPLGTEYPILTFDTRTNFYHTITGALINTAFALAPLLDDSSNTLSLRASIPGDLNLDNKVSVADLSFFALNFGTNPGLHNEADSLSSWRYGDFNTDGQITVADLSLLALNFGFDLDAATPALGLTIHELAVRTGIDLSSIPEPNTTALLTALIIIAQTTRRRS